MSIEMTDSSGNRIWQGPHRDTASMQEVMFEDPLKHQLVAHAPEVPDWFRPVMPERQAKPNRLSLGTADLDLIINSWHWDDCGNSLTEYFSGVDLTDDQHTAVLEYELELESWQDAVNQWDLERERQRLAQWPWEYARLVMEAER